MDPIASQALTQLIEGEENSQRRTPPDQPKLIGRLFYMQDDKKLEEKVYTNKPLVIGRRKCCDITISNDFISTTHCKIYTNYVEDSGEYEGDVLVFCEDWSSNGTFCNNKLIGKGNTIVLCHGDILNIKRGIQLTYQHEPNGKENQSPSEYMVVEEKYQITDRRLGIGAFAEVRLALVKSTKDQLAVKILDKKKIRPLSQMTVTDFAREVTILKSMNHPNIVRVHDVIETSRNMYIFLQLVAGGDLFDYVKKSGRIPEDEAKYMFFQLLKATQYLHNQNISHRDLKPENILRATSQPYTRLMITDFGMARVVGRGSMMKTMCGTLTYVAPEVLTGHHGYDKSVDCWSLGVILYVMVSGAHPFASTGDENDATLCERIRSGLIDFPLPWFDGISSEAKTMITGLVAVNPALRLTVNDALAFDWITNNEDELEELYKSKVLVDWDKKRTSGGRKAGIGNSSLDGIDGNAKTVDRAKKQTRNDPYPTFLSSNRSLSSSSRRAPATPSLMPRIVPRTRKPIRRPLTFVNEATRAIYEQDWSEDGEWTVPNVRS